MELVEKNTETEEDISTNLATEAPLSAGRPVALGVGDEGIRHVPLYQGCRASLRTLHS